MNTCLRRLVCAVGAGLALSAAMPSPTTAQERRSFVPTLDSIGPGCCTIRVRQSGLEARGRFQGRPAAGTVLLGDCSGTLCGSVQDPSRGLPLLPGALVEMKSGTHAGKGLVIGAVSGAGLVLGMVLIGGCDGCDAGVGEYALLGLIGAAGGGALGALVGALMPRWIPVRH